MTVYGEKNKTDTISTHAYKRKDQMRLEKVGIRTNEDEGTNTTRR